MHKTKSWLISFLALQILFAAGLYWKNAYTSQRESVQALFGFDQKQVNRIIIGDGNNTATLEKLDQNWVLSELQQLPANKNKLTDFLDKLTQLKPGWPVATTKDSHSRFKVDENEFIRHVQLYQDDGLIGELFVGSSPSFRKGHVRRANDNAVYSVMLNSYELPADNTQWLDTSLLSAKDINVIKGADFSLNKGTTEWHFDLSKRNENISNAPELDKNKANKLVSVLTSLRVLGLATDDDFVANESSIKSLEVSGSSNWRYEFFEKDEKYYIRRNDIDTLFTLGKSDYEILANMNLDHLTKQNKAENPKPEIVKSDS